MPVSTTSSVHFSPGTVTGSPPSAPTSVTSVTKDAGATVSFYAPADVGSGAVTHYVITPYVSGSPQSAATVAVGSLTSLATSAGTTALQAAVTGLTNSVAYTFTVKARNAYGDSPESAASGENTPLSGLVFGDDFNGPAGGPVDPEWWIYLRCGYLGQSEVQYYLPDHCVLDGASSLKLTAEHASYTGPSYPTAGGGSQTQPWKSGACQSNAKTWAPTAGNTMTFEGRFQICAGAGSGYWPGFFWLEGQDYLNAWKTDPYQSGWDSTGKAEIDIAEWTPGRTVSNYATNCYTGGSYQVAADSGATNLSAAMHTYQARWKPGASVSWWRDGSQTSTESSSVPASGCRFFLLVYLQMLAGGSTATQSCYLDWIRVFDQNLG